MFIIRMNTGYHVHTSVMCNLLLRLHVDAFLSTHLLLLYCHQLLGNMILRDWELCTVDDEGCQTQSRWLLVYQIFPILMLFSSIFFKFLVYRNRSCMHGLHHDSNSARSMRSWLAINPRAAALIQSKGKEHVARCPLTSRTKQRLILKETI